MEKTIRVLMNEEDADQADLNERELRRKGISFVARRVSNREDFVVALEEFRPDIILTDYCLAGFEGMVALRLVQERYPFIPVIIVTGSIDEETAADTIKAGAADYVLKTRLTKLSVAVESALARAEIRRGKDRAEKELKEAFLRIQESADKLRDINLKLQDAKVFSESIIYTIRQPLIVLDEHLRVVSASQAFYSEFQVSREESEGRFIYELGNGQWNIPRLREVLETIIPRDSQFNDFEVEHEFPKIGRRIMRLNGRQIRQAGAARKALLLLAVEDVTERVMAQRKLEESEEKYRGFIQSINSIILRFNSAGAITFLNRFGEKIFGYTEEEVLDKPLIGTIIPEKDEEGNDLRGMVGGILAHPEQYYFRQVEGRKKDGGRVWFQWSAKELRDERGRIKEILVDGNDVTGEMESRRMLREVQGLVESSPDIMARFDGEIRLVYANPLFMRIIGRPWENVADKAVRDIGLPREKAAEIEDILNQVREEKKHLRTVIELKGREYHMQVVPEAGRRLSFKVYAVDITDRKQMEDRLRRSEYELRTLLEGSPDIIIRFDRALKYLYVNPTYERITGMPKDRLYGRSNEELGMPHDQSVYWENYLRSAVENGHEQSMEFELSGVFGKRYFWGKIVPEFAKSGLVESVLVIARDITDRRKVEEQIRYISFHDRVTGLFNRAYFEEELKRLDTGRMLPLGIIMGDVNHLKLANDFFGHGEGDRLLRQIAGILKRSCRNEDIVARWGGDEFAVILPKISEEAAFAIRARIKEACRQSEGTAIHPSLALGIAAKDAADRNIYQTVRVAEERMYANKLAERGANEETALSALLRRSRENGYDAGGHAERLKKHVDGLRHILGLSDSQYDILRLLARLHDIGKAALPRSLLQKPGRLSPGEWEVVRKYPEASYRVANTFSDTTRVADEMFGIRENWDGSGYPRQIKGTGIPYLARLLAILDAYDVMTHERPYARTFTRDEAVAEIMQNAGRQFDPELAARITSAIIAGTGKAL